MRDASLPQIYITCHLNAVPANDPEAPHKACTFMNGRQVARWRHPLLNGLGVKRSLFRWRSADGNDYLCANCQTHGGVGHMKPSTPGKFGPRGFGKPENQWKGIAKTKTRKFNDSRPLVHEDTCTDAVFLSVGAGGTSGSTGGPA